MYAIKFATKALKFDPNLYKIYIHLTNEKVIAWQNLLLFYVMKRSDNKSS